MNRKSAKTGTAENRRGQLAAIHVARRDLGMDEDTYRLMLREVAGADSSKDLDAAGRRRVLDHMRRLGGLRKPRKRVAQHPGTPHNIDREAMLQKIEAQLADMRLPWAYAHAIAKQQTGIERVTWLRKQEHLAAVIAALHVEQEKRGLLTQVDELLARAGMSREQLAARYELAGNWSRRRSTLRAIIALIGPLPQATAETGENKNA
ncbi:gp16 family protein [Desulfobulbus elongatus]|uniref:gp16 family protein n=1 Tax=Desulfobulbus elongatus TaxID=53332 RepID=UPI0009FE3B51|nr:regulatory protein GemA [Desulfobulbus elongatus]